MGKVVKLTEHFFWMMVWIILVLIAAGFLLHIANARGLLPGFIQGALSYTNLSAQAG